MVRLSELIANESYMPMGFGLVVFGELATYCLEETEEENQFLEGLCPERILLNDDWFSELKEVKIARSKKVYKSYAYYAPEYLAGKTWDKACTSFAVFAMAYRLLTGELPYVGHVPEELLCSEDGIKYIQKKRKEALGINLTSVPPTFREFIAKGLALKRKDRYQSIGDTAEDYSALADTFRKTDNDSTSNDSDDLMDPDFYKMLSQNNSTDFTLDVRTPSDGNLDDLVGLQDLKKYLRNNVLAVLKNPEKAQRYDISIPNGLLLYGPPGCGKTAVAQKFAEEAQMRYAVINAQDIASTLVHGTQRLIKQLFDQAAIAAPIVLIFDEVETMTPNRNHPDNVKVAEDTNAFLSELNDCGKRGIFVIGTTNRPQFMDSAILRSGRFDKKVYVPLPDEQTRTEIFHAYLRNRPVEEKIDYPTLGKLTSSGYVSSDIRQICNEVAIRAFNDDAIITQTLIEEVIRDGSPSVSKNELRTYEETRKYMEPASKYGPYINQIGFR